MKNYLFTEKFRPKTLDELILPKSEKQRFESGLVNNMLFTGSPGNGKTSAALVLARQFKYNYKYINTSVETGIDVIRDVVIPFASRRSLLNDDKLKLVILDEIEGASSQFFKGLRAVVQQFHTTTRFIIISNYLNEIPEPLQDRRFYVLNFDFDKEYENDLYK